MSFQRTERLVATACQRSSSLKREPMVLVRLIKHIHKRIYAQRNQFFRRFGFSYPEYEILMILYGSPELSVTPTQVAEAAGEKPANVTRLTDLLCEKRLIRRQIHHEDRRKTTLTLEPAGYQFIEHILPEFGAKLVNQVGHFSEQEMLVLEELLKKLLHYVDGAHCRRMALE